MLQQIKGFFLSNGNFPAAKSADELLFNSSQRKNIVALQALIGVKPIFFGIEIEKLIEIFPDLRRENFPMKGECHYTHQPRVSNKRGYKPTILKGCDFRFFGSAFYQFKILSLQI